MSGLVAGMECFVVRLVGAAHGTEDLDPALAQAAQGTGMTLALVSVLLVVSLSPNAFLSA